MKVPSKRRVTDPRKYGDWTPRIEEFDRGCEETPSESPDGTEMSEGGDQDWEADFAGFDVVLVDLEGTIQDGVEEEGKDESSYD